MTRLLSTLLSFVLLTLLALAAAWLPSVQRDVLAGPATVTDGDTLRVNEVPVRLEGIDAPELKQTCARRDGENYSCGVEARTALADLIDSGRVRCEVEGKDRYGRSLALCRTGADDRDVGAAMVRQGHAVAYGRSRRYLAEEDRARREKRGLWAGSFEPPSDWRKAHAPRRGDLDALF